MSELIESLQSVLDQPSLRLLNEKLAAMDQQGDARGFLDGITTETDGCVNSVVTTFCELVSAALGCNTAIYTLGAGANAKAAGCYLSKYASKRQHERKHTTLIIAYEAAKHLRAHPSTAEDSGTNSRTAKYFSQRILNAGTEIAATEAATINLHTWRSPRRAEEASETIVYIDVWGICRRAATLAHSHPHPRAPRSRGSAPVDVDGAAADLRDRFGIDSGESIPTENEYEKIYKVNNAMVMATQSQHYAFRSARLAHLNALEFFMLYDVQRAKAARADAPTGPGRHVNESFELVSPHPLVGSHVIVRRSKLAVPLLAGSPSPHQPKASAAPRVARKAWGEWSCYYAALLIPWGCRGSASASTLTDEHHAPRLRVVDLLAWWRSMELRSVVAWSRVLLLPKATDDVEQATWKLQAREKLCVRHEAEWVAPYLRPFTSGSGPSPATSDGMRDSPLFTIAAYRLSTLENMTGAFDTSGSDTPGMQHRSQSRDLWGRHGVPDAEGDGVAWDTDEVAELIREEETNKSMLDTLRSGRDFFAAMRRASNVAALQVCLRAKLGPGATSVSPDPTRVWRGTTASRGFAAPTCQTAAELLAQPFIADHAAADAPAVADRAPVTDPFSDEDPSETADGTMLHERQRAAGRQFLACMRAVQGNTVPAALNLTMLCMGAAGTGI
jgi:hypothetical protein